MAIRGIQVRAVDRPVPLRKSNGPNSTRGEVAIKLNQTRERRRERETFYDQKHSSDFEILIWLVMCSGVAKALLSSFRWSFIVNEIRFLSLEGFMDWKDEAKSYIDGKIIPSSRRSCSSLEGILDVSSMCYIRWAPPSVTGSTSQSDTKRETKSQNKKETKLCLSIFSCLFEKKKLFFIHLTIKWYPFSLFLSQIFFFGCLRGKHKAEESSILSRPKKKE